MQGINGAAGTEYRTERESFTKIISLESDASGPGLFRVYLKNGRILTYGKLNDSTFGGERVRARPQGDTGFSTMRDGQENRMAWALARVEDRSGNYMTFRYSLQYDPIDGSHEQSLARIEYTASSIGTGMPATRSVDFGYEPRPDVRAAYVSGFKMRLSQRLSAIHVSAPNPSAVSRVRSYILKYLPDSASSISLLSSFQECDGAGACLPPMSFGWTPESDAFDEVDTGITDLMLQRSSIADSSYWVLNPVDVDGDGRDDLLYRKPDEGTGHYKWVIRFGSPAGYTPGAIDAVALPEACNSVEAGHNGRWADVNLDGRMDVSMLEWDGCATPGAANWLKHFRRTNNPGGPAQNSFWRLEDDGKWGEHFWYADLDGDALPELVRVASMDGRPQLGYRPNVGGTLQPFQHIVTSDRNDNNQFVVNLDGSGRTSLLFIEMRFLPGHTDLFEEVGQRYWSMTQHNGVFEKQETTLVRTDVSQQQYVFVDLNGDGLPEAVRAKETGGDLEILVNTGDGFAEPYAVDLPPGFEIGTFHQDNGIRLLDFNQDGRQDLLLMDSAGGTRAQLVLLLSTGTSFIAHPLAIPVGQVTREGFKMSQTLDANGDGLTDLAQVVNGSLHLYLRRGPSSGLLSSVVDSLGARVEFTYKPMSDATVYTPGSTCASPQLCMTHGKWLVSEHRSDAGDHPMRVQQYTYEDARLDVLGRGWLGFGAMTVRETAAGTELRTEFDNRTRVGTFYPYAQRPSLETAKVISEGRLRLQTRASQYTFQLRTGSQGGTLLTVLPDVATEEVYDRLTTEPGPAGLLRRIDMDWEFDWTYGNVTARRQTVSNGEYAEWSAEYQNDAGAWLVGLSTIVHETSTVAGVSVTRTRTFAYQPGTTLLSKEMVEPGHPTLELATTYLRDSAGLVNQIDSTGVGFPTRTTHLTYDTLDRTYPSTVTNALGHTVSYAYHPGLGVPAVQVDENGVPTRWRYDGFGRVRRMDAPDAADIDLEYLACSPGSGCALQVHSLEASGQEGRTNLDRLGRTVSVSRRAFGDGDDWLSTVNEYDALGRVARIVEPSPTGWKQVTTTFSHDALGRVLKTTYPDDTSVTRKYEANKVTTWDEKNNVKVAWLDAYGRTQSTEDVLGSQRIVTRYTYGPFGLLESMLNGYGQGPRFQYDRLGQQTQVQEPDSGLATSHYNSFGELMDRTDGNGDTTVYTRDLLGRVLTETSRDGVSRFAWDKPVPGVTGAALGRLYSSTQEGDPGTAQDDLTTVYTYDALGRPVKDRWVVEDVTYDIDRSYDASSRLSRLSYPGVGTGRFAVDYEYTTRGQMKLVRGANQGPIYWRADGRNGQDQLSAEFFGNGVVSQRRYDQRGRLLFIDSKVGTQPLQTLAYEYEANGNLRARHDRVGKTTEDFAYDTLDRLKTWTFFQNCRSSAVDYSYDDLGNLLGRTGPPGSGDTMSYFYEQTGGAGPHAVSRSSLGSYTYDHNGNQVSAPGRTVDYTTFNLPSRITASSQTVTFRYDAARTRTVKRSSSGEVTVYIGGLYEVRRAAAGTAMHVFKVMGAERQVSEVSWTTDTAGQVTAQRTLYVHPEQLGSVETLSDETGGVYERMRYEPFGGRRYPQSLSAPQSRGSARVRVGFTGHEHDEELGLINMKGRMYDPVLGRFLSPDPFVPAPLTSQSLNRYSYVFNNPLRFTDPSGFMPTVMPVIVYDSWYGGYVSVGSSMPLGRWVETCGDVTPGTSTSGSVGSGTCSRAQIYEEDKRTMSEQFAYFVLNFYAQHWDDINRAVAYEQGGILGFLAGSAPLMSLVSPPDGKSRQFYHGYAVGMGLSSLGQLIIGGVEILGGAAGEVGGGAAALTGVGTPAGVAVMAGSGLAIAEGVAVVANGLAGAKGVATAVQMANQAGDAGGSSPPAKGTQNTETTSPKNLLPRQTRSEMTGSKVDKLAKDMKKNGFDPSKPIDVVDVDGKLIIHDGHHRAAAALKSQIQSVPINRVYASPSEAQQMFEQAAEAAAQRPWGSP